MSSGLQNKLLNYEVSPPAGVWERIAGELDEAELEHKFPSQLYAMEVTPPANAWNRIAASLKSEEATAIPERRRIAPVWRYAAAAAIVGLIAFSLVKIISNSNTDPGVAKTTPSENVTPVITGEKNIPEEIKSNPVTDDSRNDAALEASKQTYAKLDLPKGKLNTQISNYFSNPVALSSVEGELNPEETYRELDQTEISPFTVAQEDPIDDVANRYLMMMTPDGNIIRMSKKWGSLLCCVSGQEQDEDCKSQLKRWREKLASSSHTTSSGNFMDILGLISSLQDNN